MVSGGVIILVSIVVISISISWYLTIIYEPVLVYAKGGEPIQVGPVQYIIEHIGEHNGNKDTRPEHTFFQIRIIAENMGTETTRMVGGQFYFIDENDEKHKAVYGKFSSEDLFGDTLYPNKPVSRTTQFDVPFDENAQYKIRISPTKPQSSLDIGIVCVTNC